MGFFDQSSILSVAAPRYSGNQVFLSWTTSAAAGTPFQVYLNAALAAVTTQTGVWIAVPTGGVNRVDIGAVDPADENTDFGGSLPSAPRRRASLQWTGGLTLASDLSGFHVYWGGSPGAAVSYASPIADITAFPGGATVASGSFSYTSEPLTSGVYHFGVKPYDSAGNQGTAVETTVTIAVPPGPPSNLGYTFHPGGTTPTVTLAWGASPG